MSNTVKYDSQATANTADLTAREIKNACGLKKLNRTYQSPIDIDEAATVTLVMMLIGLTLLRSHTMMLPLLLEETTTSHMLLIASAVIGA